jgi:hypothetical protein
MNTSVASPTSSVAPTSPSAAASNAASASSASSAESHQHTDQPLPNAALSTLSLDEIIARRQALSQEMEMIARAEQAAKQHQREEAEAAAKAQHEALLARVRQLPKDLGVADHNAVMALIRSVLAEGRRPQGARSTATSSKGNTKARGHSQLDPKVKALAMLAIQNGATEKEVTDRYPVSRASFWIWKAQLRKAGKLKAVTKAKPAPRKAKPASRKPATKAPTRSKRGKVIKSPNKTGKTRAPYAPEVWTAVEAALRQGASVPSLSRRTGISKASLHVHKQRYGLVGKVGGKDVSELEKAGVVSFPASLTAAAA